MFRGIRAVAERVFRRAPRVVESRARSLAPRRIAYGVAAGIAAMAACKEYKPPVVTTDVPVSAVDGGLEDATVREAVGEFVAAPVTRIFRAGVLDTALKFNRATEISFALPEELRDLFGQVRFFGIIGPRVDAQNRSPFSVTDFKEENGTVSASIKPLRGAESNTWHLVLELGEGEEAKYAWYEIVVEGRTSPADAGTRDARRRDDAGAAPRDVAAPPRDVATGDARIRIRP